MPPSTTTRFGLGDEALVVVLRPLVRQAREAARDHLGHRGEVVLAVEALHAELAVVRLLRHRVLKDHHRSDDVLPLNVGDVEALDTEGRDSRSSTSRSSSSASTRRSRRCSVWCVSDGERDLGVLGGELLQAPLLATLRRPHLDARAATLGEELLERGEVAGTPRDDDLRRDARRRAVVLDAELLQHGRRVPALDVLEVERVAVDHLPLAEREDLDGAPVAVYGEPDHVDRADRALVGRLALGEMPDGEEPVAQAGRLLEALRRRRVEHPLLELPLDRLRLAREELDHAVDDGA